MATTFSDLPATRRVVVGTSSTGQGLDGVSELTRTAYESMLAQSWTVSTDAPAIPVHDYDRALPSGDAWKACYGYDASARTERGACGAVVYSFALPADALTGDPCNITALSLRVIGDRYLDAGVDVHAVLSASAEPPAVAALVARTPDATVCATGDQEEAPNKRHGVTATVDLAPAAAATAYIHIALLMHDYLTTRGAWIEGGAMLADGSVAVTFSRDVAEAQPTVIPGSVNAPTTEQAASARSPYSDQPRWAAQPHMTFSVSISMIQGQLQTTMFDDPLETALGMFRAPVFDAVGCVRGIASTTIREFTAAARVSRHRNDTVEVYLLNDDIIWPEGVLLVRSFLLQQPLRLDAIRLNAAIATTCPLQWAAYTVGTKVAHFYPGMDFFAEDFWRGRATSFGIIDFSSQNDFAPYTTITIAQSSRASDFTPPTTVSVPIECVGCGFVAEGSSISELPANHTTLDSYRPITIILAIGPGGLPSEPTGSCSIPALTNLSLVGTK